MEEDLISKTVKVTQKQARWVASKSRSFSRYMRSLLDKEIGAEETKTTKIPPKE